MAKELNRSRVQLSYMVAFFSASIMIFSKSMFEEGSIMHLINDMLGYALVIVCALGRIWSTFFIGGLKNERLIKEGPFSIVRNPLYVFSMTGIIGIGLISNHYGVMLILFILFAIVFYRLVTREENFLLNKFGQEYAEYMKTTPRFIPDFKLFHQPEAIEVRTSFIVRAMRDSLVWFWPLPFFEILDYLHAHNVLPTIWMN